MKSVLVENGWGSCKACVPAMWHGRHSHVTQASRIFRQPIVFFAVVILFTKNDKNLMNWLYDVVISMVTYLSGVLCIGTGWGRKGPESESPQWPILLSEFTCVRVGGSILEMLQFYSSITNIISNKITSDTNISESIISI